MHSISVTNTGKPVYQPSNRKKSNCGSLSPLLSQALAVAAKRLPTASASSLPEGAYELAENFRLVGVLEVGPNGETSGRFSIVNIGIVAPSLIAG